MKIDRFTAVFLLLMLAQILICAHMNFSPLLTLTILPMMILFIPIRHDTTVALIVAFSCGFLVDFFGTGTMGLTIISLLPVAALRIIILKLVFGNEIFSRGEDVSLARQGFNKVSMAILIVLFLYLLIYDWIESAGTRNFWFNFGKTVLSTFLSYLACILAVGPLTREGERWR